MIWVKTFIFRIHITLNTELPVTPIWTNARHCRVYYAYFYFIFQLCGWIVIFVSVTKNSSISPCRWQLAGCQRWHQTAGVRFATAAPNLANYLCPAFFLSAASRNSDGPNISPQYLQTEASRTGWRGPGCVTPAGPRWVTAAHSYRSAVRPTRANILRQETHSSFTCAKEHTHALLPFPLDSFDMVPSLCFALPSVASLPLFLCRDE